MRKGILLGLMLVFTLPVYAGGDHHHGMTKDKLIDHLAKIQACVEQGKLAQEDAQNVIYPHVNTYIKAHYQEQAEREINGRAKAQSKRVFVHMGWVCEASRKQLMSLQDDH